VTKIGTDGSFGFYYAAGSTGLYVVNVVWDKVLRNVKNDYDLKRLYLENGMFKLIQYLVEREKGFFTY